MQTLTIFILTIAFGAVAVFFALKARRYAIKESKVPLKLHAYAIMAFCIGFSLHTLGDLLAAYYGDSMELLLESIAHVIILAAFIIFYNAAHQTVKSTKEYWFK